MLMSMMAEFVLNNSGMSFFDYATQNSHKDVAMTIVTHDRWAYLEIIILSFRFLCFLTLACLCSN